MEAGRPHDVRLGSVSQVRRIESGILSWGIDMTPDDTPYELGLDRLVELGNPADFIGKAHLVTLKDAPVTKVNLNSQPAASAVAFSTLSTSAIAALIWTSGAAPVARHSATKSSGCSSQAPPHLEQCCAKKG